MFKMQSMCKSGNYKRATRVRHFNGMQMNRNIDKMKAEMRSRGIEECASKAIMRSLTKMNNA